MRGRRLRNAIGLVTLSLGGASLAAQQECSAAGYGGSAGRACQTFVDAVRAFHPVAGVLVSGGNPVLGSGETLGGLGHLSVSARVNMVHVSVPDPDSAGRASVPSSFDGQVPAPVLEGALGVFKGGRGGFLAIDALASAVLLPTGGVRHLSVDSSAARVGQVALGLGYGLRVALLRGGFGVPAVAVSLMRRHLPRLQYGDISAGDSVQFTTDLGATNVRATASMRLLFVDVAAGVGWDHYGSSAAVEFLDPTRPLTNPQRIALDAHESREVLFLDGGLDLTTAKLVGELGYQTGADQHLTTNFTGFDPKAGHVFAGVGLRVSF